MNLFEVSRTRLLPQIRLINLVDILFNLLIFFVATTTFRVDMPLAVKLVLPEAKTAEDLGKEKVERILISVGPDETIYIESEPVELETLESVLRQAKRENPDVLLQFAADKAASYGKVVAVIDAARSAGIRNITAFTKRSLQ